MMLDSTVLRRRGRLFLAFFALAAFTLAGLPSANAQSAPGTVPLAPPAGPAAGSAAPSGPPIYSANDPRNPLHLTKAQQQRRNAIIMQYEPKIQAVIGNPKLTQQEKQTKLKGIFAQANAQLEAILTPSQHAANIKLMHQAQARQAQMQLQVNSRRAEIQKMEKQLESTLTPDQKSKLNALSAATRQQLLALQADKTLTMQQKQQKYMAIGRSYTSEAQKIYTPAQRAMLEKIRAKAMSPLGTPAPGH